jgi:hypothetical protein
MGEREALELARKVDRIVATKGQTIVELELGKKPGRDQILALLIGPSGKLRAPSFVIGRTLFVGFPKAGAFEGLS